MAHPVEQGFLANLRERPADDATRIVYADWLEENGRATESEFLRLQIELAAMAPDDPGFERSSNELREHAAQIDPRWRAVVGRGAIEGCSMRFDFACPKQWDALVHAGTGVRFCGGCKQMVYYSTTIEEAYQHARRGRCVVVDLVQLRTPGDLEPRPEPPEVRPMLMGSVATPPDWRPPPDTDRE